MKNLITEARELCEKATRGPWEYSDTAGEIWSSESSGDVVTSADSMSGLCIGEADAAFIARSRTLIPELCDALEKAESNLDAVWDMYKSAERELKKVQEKNKQLTREVSALAAESVKRDRALARLEAEVEAALREKQERSGCEHCRGWDKRCGANYCPMCGRELPKLVGTIGGEIVQHALKELEEVAKKNVRRKHNETD